MWDVVAISESVPDHLKEARNLSVASTDDAMKKVCGARVYGESLRLEHELENTVQEREYKINGRDTGNGQPVPLI